MTSTFRKAHLVVGAIAVVAFLVTGLIMRMYEPPVSAMEWAERLLFFAEPMAGRLPGPLSANGLFALFGGVLLYTIVSFRMPAGGTT